LLVIVCVAVLSQAQSDAASCTAAPPTGYTVVDLGSLGTGSDAFGINSKGDVTGEFFVSAIKAHAFLWTAAGGMQDLGLLPGGTFSVGLAVNNSDEVVGYGDGTGFKQHAFLWTASGGMQDLGALGSMANASFAYGIDDAGRIVGGAYDDSDSEYSTAWINARLRTLGPKSFGEARAISPTAGYVAGLDKKGDAFVWRKSAGFTDLGRLPGGNISFAYGVNNFGNAVGYSDFGDPAHNTTAFFWSPGTGIISMGTLGGNPSQAQGINDQCIAVGWSIIFNTIDEHAFVWSQPSGIIDLNTLLPPNSGWTLTNAYAINASGQIVGSGEISGRFDGFLATPTN
jgi:probable HAF family extracellular repeat protein